MAKSFAETHPHNPNATCKCEHWQSCIDCHPTAHGEKYITDAMRVRQAVAQAVLHEPIRQPQVRTGNCLLVGVCASEGHKIQAQRTWVGLTDIDYAGLPLEQVGLVRWAEAKLKEKNT